MVFRITDNVRVDRDSAGAVRHLEHLQQPFVAVVNGRTTVAADDVVIGGMTYELDVALDRAPCETAVE